MIGTTISASRRPTINMVSTLVVVVISGGLLYGVAPIRELLFMPPAPYFLFVVSAVSAIALAVSIPLVLGAVRVGEERAFGPPLGFMSMAALWLAYGLTTPQVLTETSEHADLSVLLGLCVPSVFFAYGYIRPRRRLGQDRPPMRWLLTAGVSILLVVYDTLAVSGVDLPRAEVLTRPPISTLVTATSIALLAFAAWREYRVEARAGGSMGVHLTSTYVLLAGAQVAMLTSARWTSTWWAYHVAVGAAMMIALIVLWRALDREKSTRTVIESMLGLKIEADSEVVEAIAALAAAVELKDKETQGHNLRVARLAVEVGRQLALPNPGLRVLAQAGLLHDIGKLGVPDAILHKPGPLNADERRVIEQHPTIGLDIVRRLGGMDRVAATILAHHERVDGAGYPMGLVGDRIPLEARIIAAADTFDVLCSDRPYRRGRPRAEAIEVVRSLAGTQLDARVVVALTEIVENGEAVPVPGLAASVQPSPA